METIKKEMAVRAGISTDFHEIPEEMLLLVFDFLNLDDVPVPSLRNFDKEPKASFTRCESTPLKDLTLVCKRWRRVLLPRLFVYSRIELSPTPRWVTFTTNLLQRFERKTLGNPRANPREKELVQAMNRRHYDSCVRSTTWTNTWLEYITEAEPILFDAATEERIFIPSARGELSEFLGFVETNGLEKSIESFTLCAEPPFDGSDLESNWASQECIALWRTLFSAIDPSRVVIAAHPSVMALLAQSRMGTHDDWLFQQHCHYLELRRDGLADASSAPTETAADLPDCLRNMREWTHLGYNEGSSIPAYSQYEYFHYCAPKVLYHLLLWISKEQEAGQRTPRLRSLNYVACFPLAIHVSDLLKLVMKLDGLERLETRFSPRLDSDVLDDARMGRSDRKDCWNEFNQACRAMRSFMNRAKHQGKKGLVLRIADYETERLKEEMDDLFNRAQWRKEGDCFYLD